jgi:hypothetical protein
MKSYRIYFGNGKDIKIEAERHEITTEGHLNLFQKQKKSAISWEEPFYIVAAGHWTIVDIADLEEEKELVELDWSV